MTTDKIRILVVGEPPTQEENDLLRLLSKLDRGTFLMSWMVNRAEGLRAFEGADPYDVSIVDLPDGSGIDFLAAARRIRPRLPIVLATSRDASEVLAAMQRGAVDCIFREDLTAPVFIEKIRLAVQQSRVTQSLGEQSVANEERYRRIVDEANEIIYRISPTGYFTFVNPKAAAIVGRTVAECQGLHFLTLIRKDYRQVAAEFYLEQISERIPITYLEFPAVAKDGTEVWLGQNVQLVIENGVVIELQALGRDITTQKQTEQYLLDSEQRYRLLFEANPHPMWVYEIATLRFLAVNQAAIKHYGYSLNEFLQLTIKDIRPPEDHQRLFDSLAGTGGTLHGTWRHRKKDGATIDVEINAHPLIFDGKSAELITATDVTDKVRAEAERQVILDIIQSVNVTSNLDELLRLIHDSLKTILYAENCFVALSDTTTNLMHFEFWVDKFDPVPAPRPSGGFTGYVLDTSEPLLLTEEFKEEMYGSGKVKKTGTSSASWLAVPLRTPSQTIGVLVVQHYENKNVYSEHDRDFLASVGGQIALAIERKRAEKALQAANRRAMTEYEQLLVRLTTLAETFGTARELPTICQAFYSFAFASTQCNGMFISLCDSEKNEHKAIYACSEGVEIPVTDLPPMANSDSPHCRAVATGEVIIEDDFQTAMIGQPVLNVGLETNPRLPQSSLVIPMVIKDRVIGAVEVQSAEMAAFKKEHVTAMRMAANLAANAIENVRLIELEKSREEQMRQSQKMEAIGQLAGGVAHDFNNLLTAINGYSDLALRQLPKDGSAHVQISEVKKAGTRAASLTRQLLAFSRKQIMQAKVLDLNSIVADMDKMLRRLIGEDVDLVTLLKSGLGQISADPGQMEQVLMNLVVNARDAMPDGGKITIETGNVELGQDYAISHASVRPGRYIFLAVSDTGIGMDVTLQKRVFDPFFTTKEVGKGTGLGLSTVYGIVKQSGGNIWLYSEPGTGTTFKVYLPRVDEAVDHDTECELLGIPQRTETILLVEDEEIVRTMTRQILEMSGHKVLEAACGSEAIQICGSYDGPVHLVLTDVVMPQMNGPSMVKEVMRIRPNIKTLFMSGYTDNAILRHGILEEGMPFLQKPFSPDGLALKVRDVLNCTNT